MIDLKEFKVSKNLITYLDQASGTSEAYRILRTNINYALRNSKTKSIIITSPGISDGKTVTACNLAICMANEENRVLLIDADLRKPTVHKQFKIPNYTGLSNILLEDVDINEALHNISYVSNLTILTSGLIPKNPSELVSSSRMKELLNILINKFDIIIIDTPPAGYVSDAAILSSLVGGVILAIAEGKTKIGVAKHAVKTLQNVNTNLLGVVMTKVNIKNSGYYY